MTRGRGGAAVAAMEAVVANVSALVVVSTAARRRVLELHLLSSEPDVGRWLLLPIYREREREREREFTGKRRPSARV